MFARGLHAAISLPPNPPPVAGEGLGGIRMQQHSNQLAMAKRRSDSTYDLAIDLHKASRAFHLRRSHHIRQAHTNFSTRCYSRPRCMQLFGGLHDGYTNDTYCSRIAGDMRHAGTRSARDVGRHSGGQGVQYAVDVDSRWIANRNAGFIGNRGGNALTQVRSRLLATAVRDCGRADPATTEKTSADSG